VFSLFPFGLRASADATAETRVAQFAEQVFAAYRAEAARKPDHSSWANTFSGSVDIGGFNVGPGSNRTADYPPGTTERVKYTLSLSVSGGTAKGTLTASYGEFGGSAYTFYTEYYRTSI
jgi:hypothetical protein